MLRWRIPLGILIVAAILGLCWLDGWLERVTGIPGMPGSGIPGVALFPVLAAFVLLAAREVLLLADAGGVRPVPWVVYFGSLLIVTSSWISPLGYRFAYDVNQKFDTSPSDWTLFALAAGVILVFLVEMLRYERPGGATVNLAAAVFTMVYVGLLMSFLVQLRMTWGVRALMSAVVVVKMGDTGAYAVGRLIGRSKMAPGLSPRKTFEGAVGALVFASVGAWAMFQWLPAFQTVQWLFPTRNAGPGGVLPHPSWGWLAFGLVVGIVGMIGDLAESLIKRDVELKDSSDWVPGFGGVLDMLDSALLAAPVAYACWAFGLVG
jgi:phosphatidate cytidylyltransferase